jgi:hypothetical protein
MDMQMISMEKTKHFRHSCARLTEGGERYNAYLSSTVVRVAIGSGIFLLIISLIIVTVYVIV